MCLYRSLSGVRKRTSLLFKDHKIENRVLEQSCDPLQEAIAVIGQSQNQNMQIIQVRMIFDSISSIPYSVQMATLASIYINM